MSLEWRWEIISVRKMLYLEMMIYEKMLDFLYAPSEQERQPYSMCSTKKPKCVLGRRMLCWSLEFHLQVVQASIQGWFAHQDQQKGTGLFWKLCLFHRTPIEKPDSQQQLQDFSQKSKHWPCLSSYSMTMGNIPKLPPEIHIQSWI